MGRLFGTDGARGIANEFLTCEIAMKIGRAVATVLSGGRRSHPVVVVGMDTRLSSNMLACSLEAGLCSVGADVIHLGVVPTPAVAFLVGKYKANAGIMISASHNPSEYNGIKIFSEEGYKLPDALEERIESIVLDNIPKVETVGAKEIGQVTYASRAVDDYIEHLCSTTSHSLEGLKIAVDCANGSASVTARKLFEALGAEAEIMFDQPDGYNINEGCGSTHMEALREYVLTHDVDAGIAYDGDADRFLCIDDKGEFIDGDMIMAIIAKDMKERGKLAGNTVVGTIMTNFGFGKFCDANGINFEATKVGDRYVLERMLLNGYNFGGEQSGHIIFRDFCTTGDGQLTSIQLLSHVRRSQKKLSELKDVMVRYPQAMVNIRVTNEAKVAFYTDSKVKKLLRDTEREIGDGGRLVIRPSGTEPLIRVMAEGEDYERTLSIVEETARELENLLSAY